MKPEKLKVIAEGMGYEVAIKPRNIRGTITDAVFNYNGEVWYNPLTNAEQCMEIMEKLKLDVVWWPEQKEWSSERCIAGSSTIGYTGKTITEAVCKAAYEYFIQELGS